MKDSSSSTSSSELGAQVASAAPPSAEGPATVRSVARTLLIALLWLIAFDVALGLLFRMPESPRVKPSTMQRFFDYGRSVEGKLRYRVRDTADTSGPVVSAGWLEHTRPLEQPRKASAPGKILIAVYGQSFTQQAATALTRLDPRFEVRIVAGPAAGLSHSYTVFERDRKEHDAQVAMIGIVASTFPMLVTMTPMTVMFEDPYPYTYPRYRVEGGKLTKIEPSLRSFADLQAALADPIRMQQLKDELRQNDLGYTPFVFEADILDYSTLGRGVRRAYAQKRMREAAYRYQTPRGFTNRDGVLDIARALLTEFGKSARQDGMLPYVLLFQDAGTGNSLAQALSPTLTEQGIPYLSSFEAVPPNDGTAFLKDGHFKPPRLAAFAKALHDHVDQQLGAQSAH